MGYFLSYSDPHVGNPLLAFIPSREPCFHLGVSNLRNTVVSPLDFPVGLVDDTIQHTNTFAYVEIANENSTKHCYTESDGSSHDTTPDEILRFMGLLIYFGFDEVRFVLEHNNSVPQLLSKIFHVQDAV